jgi:hypothetical protein
VWVIPGSHLWPSVELQSMLDEHGFDLPGAIPVEAKAGDVVLHATNVLHGSRSTRGGALRRVDYFAFRSIEEVEARGPEWEALGRCYLGNLEAALEARAALPEVAAHGEVKYEYRPTRADWSLDSATPATRELGDEAVTSGAGVWDPRLVHGTPEEWWVTASHVANAPHLGHRYGPHNVLLRPDGVAYGSTAVRVPESAAARL